MELEFSDYLAAGALLLATVSAWYARRSVKVAERSADIAERAERHAADSAKADTEIARIAEEQRQRELNNALTLTLCGTPASDAAGANYPYCIVVADGYQWDFVKVESQHDGGRLPPVKINGKHRFAPLGALSSASARKLHVRVEQPRWQGRVHLRFECWNTGDREPTVFTKLIPIG